MNIASIRRQLRFSIFSLMIAGALGTRGGPVACAVRFERHRNCGGSQRRYYSRRHRDACQHRHAAVIYGKINW